MKLTYWTNRKSPTERQLLAQEWRKVMKSPSRTCWDTGQPYNGLGAWINHNRKITGDI